MFDLIKKKIFIFSLFLLPGQNSFSGISVNNTSSILKIKAGSNFVVDTSVSNYKGTIVKESGASITGNAIHFNEGKVQDSGNKFNVTGVFSPGASNKIILNGGKSFRGKGGIVTQEIDITGTGNSLQGDFLLTNNIRFLNSSAQLSCCLLSSLAANIELNGGKLILDDNLKFFDNKKIIGPGCIFLNGRKMAFGAVPLVFSEPLYFDSGSDVELNSNVSLENIWTFSGVSIFDGRDNIICMDSIGGCEGRIIIERGSSLLIRNITLKKFNNNSFFCMDNSATITFQNVKIILDDNYTFSLGQFFVLSTLKITGKKTFAYQSNKRSIIHSYSEIFLDSGVTFSYDQIGSESKDLLEFEDETSFLYLNGATLHATVTGMQLKHGTLIINGDSSLSSELFWVGDIFEERGLELFGGGITIGNDLVVDDFNFCFLPGSTLNVSSGMIDYRNVNIDSWEMKNETSTININAGVHLNLYQNLNIGSGKVFLSHGANFYKYPGCSLLGSIFYYN